MYDRVRRELESYAPGVHVLGEPGDPPAGVPAPLAQFYRTWDGAELFLETLRIAPAAEVERDGELWVVGESGRDDILVDGAGAVWRREGDTGELVPDGTRFDRWLDGFVHGEGALYEADGELVDADDLFDDTGEELAPAWRAKRERRALQRDRDAAGPRWRLARALERQGALEAARDELETVVASTPGFPWAWFDLARLAEACGDVEAAVEDAVEAAICQPDYEHAGYFFAVAARLAARAGDEPRRAELAARALALQPELARAQREGAAASLADGDHNAAAELLAVALALAPRDLESLALKRQLES